MVDNFGNLAKGNAWAKAGHAAYKNEVQEKMKQQVQLQ
jgi:hypothetical protein